MLQVAKVSKMQILCVYIYLCVLLFTHVRSTESLGLLGLQINIIKYHYPIPCLFAS